MSTAQQSTSISLQREPWVQVTLRRIVPILPSHLFHYLEPSDAIQLLLRKQRQMATQTATSEQPQMQDI